MPAPAIEFAGVSLRLADGRFLLADVNLALGEGSVTAMLGRSGSGKTTLLRMVNRLNAPTGGTVRVFGRDVAGEDVIRLRRGISYVIQETGLFPHMPVARNVSMVPELAGAARDGFGPLLQSSGSTLLRSPAGTRTSFPAASDSASAWPGRWRASRRSCSWTSPSARSTRSPGRRCRICCAGFSAGCGMPERRKPSS